MFRKLAESLMRPVALTRLTNMLVATGENIVALHLLRKYGIDSNVFFYNYNIEVDFVVPEESLAVQVCYQLGDETSETYRRETVALERLAKRLQYNDLVIVTYNEEREIVQNGYNIRVVPISKWLLG